MISARMEVCNMYCRMSMCSIDLETEHPFRDNRWLSQSFKTDIVGRISIQEIQVNRKMYVLIFMMVSAGFLRIVL